MDNDSGFGAGLRGHLSRAILDPLNNVRMTPHLLLTWARRPLVPGCSAKSAVFSRTTTAVPA